MLYSLFQILIFTLSNPEQVFSESSISTLKQHPASQILNQTITADNICQKEAKEAGLSGSFAALLSTSQRSLRSIVELQYDKYLPVVNIKVSIYMFRKVERYT